MAARHGGSEATCLIDGYDFLSSKPKTMSLKIESITEQTDGLGDNFQAHSPVGKSRFMFSQGGGFFDTLTAGLHAAMIAVATGVPTTPQAVARVGVFGAMTAAVGAVFYGIRGVLSPSYEVLYENSKLSKANTAWVADGNIERGQMVQPLATKTADWNTKSLGTVVDYTLDPSQIVIPITSNTAANPSIVTTTVPHGLTTGDIILISGVATSSPTINGERTVTVISTTTFSVPVNVATPGTGGSFVRSNSSNGAAGYQHVTAFSGFTGFIGKIRHSADDTTYADLITFANVTSAPGKERATAAGTINRYVCFDGDVTGSGSITAFAGLSRL